MFLAQELLFQLTSKWKMPIFSKLLQSELKLSFSDSAGRADHFDAKKRKIRLNLRKMMFFAQELLFQLTSKWKMPIFSKLLQFN